MKERIEVWEKMEEADDNNSNKGIIVPTTGYKKNTMKDLDVKLEEGSKTNRNFSIYLSYDIKARRQITHFRCTVLYLEIVCSFYVKFPLKLLV